MTAPDDGLQADRALRSTPAAPKDGLREAVDAIATKVESWSGTPVPSFVVINEVAKPLRAALRPTPAAPQPDAGLRDLIEAADTGGEVIHLAVTPTLTAALDASRPDAAAPPMVLLDVDGVVLDARGDPMPGIGFALDLLACLGFEVVLWSAGGPAYAEAAGQRTGHHGAISGYRGKPTYPPTEEEALRFVRRRPVLQVDDDPTERVADWQFMVPALRSTPAAPADLLDEMDRELIYLEASPGAVISKGAAARTFRPILARLRASGVRVSEDAGLREEPTDD